MRSIYVDDCCSLLDLVSDYFASLDNLQLVVTNDPDEALRLIGDSVVSLVAYAYDLRPCGGPELFRAVRDLVPDLSFLFVTSYPSPQRLNELVRSERNVRAAYKNEAKGFLPALRSALAAAHEQMIRV
jgi:DNA-binding NtrC family response regulator